MFRQYSNSHCWGLVDVLNKDGRPRSQLELCQRGFWNRFSISARHHQLTKAKVEPEQRKVVSYVSTKKNSLSAISTYQQLLEC
jgi:hypothetical protein